MTDAESSRSNRRATSGRATARAIDDALLNAFKDAFFFACDVPDKPMPSILEVAKAVMKRFPATEARRVLAQLGMADDVLAEIADEDLLTWPKPEASRCPASDQKGEPFRRAGG